MRPTGRNLGPNLKSMFFVENVGANKLGSNAFIEGPGGSKKLRLTCRTNPFLISSLIDYMVPSKFMQEHREKTGNLCSTNTE